MNANLEDHGIHLQDEEIEEDEEEEKVIQIDFELPKLDSKLLDALRL
jgi:hypothetical protein